ncbi:hypothetical protein IFM89_037739 [Coptis chinensis]|uniref:F-box domain-containing protein n=1 Tax=Coptis chinensis TaxID=261450 RepID=A0A835IX41_9MAGN|nr:hypothetical protein IFM89_037739 [Coptis chinensis]
MVFFFVHVCNVKIEEVCSLSCCSRFWRDVCASDSLWIFLYRERWPSQSLTGNSHHSQYSSIEGWRSFYIKRHNEMDDRATSIIKVINQCSKSESVEVGDYQKAIADLHAMELGFKDIVLFLFAAKQNALLNLVGLHYLVFSLGVPVNTNSSDFLIMLSTSMQTELHISCSIFKPVFQDR